MIPAIPSVCMRALLLALLLLPLSARALSGGYALQAQDCDGYPQLPVVTINGLCLGLVASKSATWPVKMPRTLVELDDGRLLVIDMGGWANDKGKLWLIDARAKPATASAVLSGLNLPHKILHGPKGRFYFGEAQRIRRFEWVDGKLAALETVIDGLPHHTGYLHPLKNFAFAGNGDLLVNIGSTSDRCEKAASKDACTSGAEASVRRYRYDASRDSWSPAFTLIGRGLRNSMALAVHASGTVLQAENSIDLPNADEPYEEINLLGEDATFGWPHCYDRDAGLDGHDCSGVQYRQPWTLLPPHVAPLDALYYTHAKLAPLTGQLLMGWHGYRITGARVVAFAIDAQGRPLRQEQAQFWRAPTTPDGDYTAHAFAPTGTLGPVAQHREVISQWHAIPGLRPEGAPVGLTVAHDGSLFIVDDRNAGILRLSTGRAYVPAAVANATAKTTTPPPAVAQLLQSHCLACHVELKAQPQLLLNDQRWLRRSDGQTRIAERVFIDKIRPMPPQPTLSATELQLLRQWLSTVQ
jgi:glucose/arabinose dehydrogenase